MPAQEDLAVCIRTWDWSETSQTVSLYTRDHGLLRCLAKGSKRSTPSAAFSGGIELLTCAEVAVHIKPGADLALLTRWDLTEVFPRFRRDLAVQHAAMFAAELVQATSAERAAHPRTFDALTRALRELNAGTPIDRALLELQWHVLADAGYTPTFDRLVPSGAPLPVAAAYTFDPELGGITGPAHAAPAGPGFDWRLRASTVHIFAELAARDDHPQTSHHTTAAVSPEVADSSPASTANAATISRAARFLAAYARHVLQNQLRTLPLVFPDLSTLGPPRADRPKQPGRAPR